MGKRKAQGSELEGGDGGGGRRAPEQMAMVDINNPTWRNLFSRLDSNGDGFLEMNEIRQRLSNTNAAHQLDNSELKRLYSVADVNRDKRLNYNEFANLMDSPEVPLAWKNRLVAAGRNYVKWVIPARAPTVTAVEGRRPYDTIDARYIEEYNCNPPPIFIVLISVVELGVFIYYAVIMGGITASGPVPMSSSLIYNPRRRYEAWRYLSYMLIHAGYAHITFNLLMQLILGIPLEMVHKWWRVAIIYFSGVIAGSLGTSISDPGVYLAGASAGDYAIISAHLATVILNWKEMELAWLQLLFFVIIMGTDVGVAVYSRYTSAPNDRTGYSAHLAGAIAGLLIGIGVLRNLEVRPWEKKLWWVSVILFAVLITIAIIWNAAFPSYFPTLYY